MIYPTNPAERDELKRDCLKHATMSNGLIDWEAYEIALYGNPLFSDVSSESSASSSSDSDCIFLYATSGTNPKEDLSQGICVSSLSSSKVEGTTPLLIFSGEWKHVKHNIILAHFVCSLGLNSLVLPMLCWVVWLCFRYTATEASMRRNGEIRRENEERNKSWIIQLQGDGRHTLWRVDRHPSTWLGRHQPPRMSAPVTCRPSHPVTPVTGSGESVSPTFSSSFP